MEATGIECQNLHRDMFDEALPWWYRTPDIIPAYMYRYAGVFCGDSGELNGMLIDFAHNDKSYISDIPEHGYDAFLELPIPEDKNDIGSYIAYRLEDLK